MNQNLNITYRKVNENKHLLVNFDSGDVFEINEVGLLIWDSIGNQLSKDEVIQKVVDTYEISYDNARNDFNSYLDVLVKKKIIELGN